MGSAPAVPSHEILVGVINGGSVKQGGEALDAMNFVALSPEEASPWLPSFRVMPVIRAVLGRAVGHEGEGEADALKGQRR